jgi:HK97 family phage major capsid protein
MSMSLAEARAEAKSRLEQCDVIEKKYPDPSAMPNEDQDRIEVLLKEVDDIETTIGTLEDADQRRQRILKGMEVYSKPAPGATRLSGHPDGVPDGKRFSPGVQFIQNRNYRELKQNGAFDSHLARTEFAVTMAEGTSLIDWAMARKALLRGGSTSSGGSFVIEDHQPGMIDILQREINVLDLVPRVATNSDTIEYVREDTFTNSAAFVAEATGFTATTLGGTGVKPESALAYSTQTATVRTMAHWIPVTNRMLSDAPAIRGIIDGRLLLGLQLALESQVISGAGSGEDLTGILAAGIAVVSKGTDSVQDAIYKARTLVRNTGHGRPTAIVMNPADFQTIRLSRESASTATPGTYIMGPPSMSGAATLWGMPVVEDEAMTAGTALVGDWQQGATLFDREQGNVRAGTVNDQFIRNMQTLLAELRVAFVVWRPAVFAKVTGL